ncbi:hypothetical protein BWQ96_03132 [Gracilariopsis chorda]|uniref:Uncharacterized protein n=1 Tax=Gracilariopsis chorda TaxID=448386 RepID=A0A2V3IYB2_9FLOR|nr:hypothetical protein BWQ96_03132 [Gracilariopsis chorda]|eukprot:PXF47055.1 hypothetical protein BWQ96_03132 [Gracilariopsis chorda]
MEHSAKDTASALCKRARPKKKPTDSTVGRAAAPTSETQEQHSCASISMPSSPRVEPHSKSKRPSPRAPRTISLATEVDRRLSRTATGSLVDRPPVKLAPGATPARHPRLSSIISLETSSLDEVADANFMRSISSIRSVEKLATSNSVSKDSAAPLSATDEKKETADK